MRTPSLLLVAAATAALGWTWLRAPADLPSERLLSDDGYAADEALLPPQPRVPSTSVPTRAPARSVNQTAPLDLPGSPREPHEVTETEPTPNGTLSVHGCVRSLDGVPLPGLPVFLKSAREGTHSFTTTDHDGTYRFDVVAGEAYLAGLGAPDAPLIGPYPVDGDPFENRLREFSVMGLGSLSIRVRDAAGNPIRDALVTLQGERSHRRISGETGLSDRALFPGLVAEPFLVTVSARDYRASLRRVDVLPASRQEATLVLSRP